MKRFPWANALAFGFGVLRLSPSAFWTMTPRELAAAARARLGASDRPDPSVLRALIEHHEEAGHGTTDE